VRKSSPPDSAHFRVRLNDAEVSRIIACCAHASRVATTHEDRQSCLEIIGKLLPLIHEKLEDETLLQLGEAMSFENSALAALKRH
jgi:hypothetical protein